MWKRPDIFLGLLLAALFGVASAVLAWRIADHLLDARRSQNYWDELQDSVVVADTKEPAVATDPQPIQDGETPAGEQPETEEPEVTIPESVDFERLRAISGNAAAWLYSPDTKINYVVAQAEDNAYYLRRLLNGKAASGGSLFADYRCSADFSDWNTVIYGHYMKNGTMFGGLSNYRDQAYYEEHPVMYLYLPGQRYRLELVAGYTTDVYDVAYAVPASKEQRDEILTHAVEKSSFQSDVAVGEDDRLVTLSTCSYAYDNARYIVIGRLVED